MVYNVPIPPFDEPNPRAIAAFCVTPRMLSTNSAKALSHHLVSIYI